MGKGKELTDLEVRRLTEPGRHAVGGVSGLYLRVDSSGRRNWVLRFTAPSGKRRDMGIGAYPDVGLGQARERAREIKEQAWRGIDPIAEKQRQRQDARAAEARSLTFDQAVERYLETKEHGFRNAKHARQWRSTLETYASPVIGSLPVDRIELSHVVEILNPIWTSKTETAKRLRGRIEAVLAWATVSNYREGDNPARWKGNLDAIFPSPNRVAKKGHFTALHWRDVPEFMAQLREREGMAARALEFAILCAARSGEVRFAAWDEVYRQDREWVVPAERIKAGRQHRVPLSDDALAILDRVPRERDQPLIFPAPRGRAMSDATMSAVLKRMGVQATPHGFRSSFKDWARSCTSYADEVSELALAHVHSDATRAAYARDELIEQRRRLMAEWARYCREGIGGAGVTPIGNAR